MIHRKYCHHNMKQVEPFIGGAIYKCDGCGKTEIRKDKKK